MTTFPAKQAFQTWLETQPPDTIISTEWDCHDCPLAYFTNYNIGPISGVYWDNVEGVNRPLPKWAKAFSILVDDLGATTAEAHDLGTRIITAAQCLTILSEIPND